MSEGGEKKVRHGGRLEMPSGELLVARKCVLVEGLLGKGSSEGSDSPCEPSTSSSIQPSTSGGQSLADRRKKGPIRKLGPSSVLGRVKDFLPQMKKSNEALLQKAKTDPSSVSVEAPLQDDTQQHVEVSVALVPNEANDSDSETEDFITTPTSKLAEGITAMGVTSNPQDSPSKKTLIMEMD